MSDGRRNNGGARKGAGRKPKAVRFASQISKAEKRIADRLPQTIDNLIKLADGGYQRESRTLKPAGLIYIEQPYIREGIAMLDLQGRPIMIKTLAFPHLDPEHLVCVEHSTEIADKDRAANIYLADRIMDKPTQQKELSGPDGGAIPVVGISIEDWKKEAVQRVEQAGATLTEFGEDDDA